VGDSRGTILAAVRVVPEKRRDGILKLIGAAKLLKALTLLAAGVGLVSMGDGHSPSTLAHIAADPQNRYINHAVAKLWSIDPHKLREIGVGSFIYAALFATEGTGLLLRKLWAEYLTIVITTSFIPIEIYEMVHHTSVVKGIVIALNAAIVVYLVWRLRRDKHWPFRVDSGHGHRRRRRHALAPASGRARAPARDEARGDPARGRHR